VIFFQFSRIWSSFTGGGAAARNIFIVAGFSFCGEGKDMGLVRWQKKDDLLQIVLNRPAALNAINSGLLQEMEQGLKKYETDETIRSVLVLGEGNCFASGADIRELSGLDEDGIRKFHRLRERTFLLLETFPAPTVALIERYALGTGLELALCCDFRVASSDARLGVPSAKLGLVESYEYFARLVRAVGLSWAKKMVFGGEPIDGETAWKIGLVEEICRFDEIQEWAGSLLSKIHRNSVSSIRETKKIMMECLQDPNLSSVRDRALPLVKSMKSADFKERTQAFLEKRKRE
jgi:enoyl-CoA hydratase/carnithine racemase